MMNQLDNLKVLFDAQPIRLVLVSQDPVNLPDVQLGHSDLRNLGIILSIVLRVVARVHLYFTFSLIEKPSLQLFDAFAEVIIKVEFVEFFAEAIFVKTLMSFFSFLLGEFDPKVLS